MDLMYLINDHGMVDTMIGDSAIEDINNLLKQLSPDFTSISRRQLERIIENSTFFWAVDKDTMSVVGIVTLTMAYKPTAFFGTMGDLIVDKNYQRRGIGTELIRMLRKVAKNQNMSYIEFTSKPERVTTNNYYLKLGAIKKETNTYRFKL